MTDGEGRPTSVIFKNPAAVEKIGFQPLAFDRMGLYADPRRASWPVAREVFDTLLGDECDEPDVVRQRRRGRRRFIRRSCPRLGRSEQDRQGTAGPTAHRSAGIRRRSRMWCMRGFSGCSRITGLDGSPFDCGRSNRWATVFSPSFPMATSAGSPPCGPAIRVPDDGTSPSVQRPRSQPPQLGVSRCRVTRAAVPPALTQFLRMSFLAVVNPGPRRPPSSRGGRVERFAPVSGAIRSTLGGKSHHVPTAAI